MKKRYPFLAKTWLRLGLTAAFAAFSLNLQAQISPAIQWDKSIGGNSGDYLFKIIQTADGGFLSGGYSISTTISGNKTEGNKGSTDYWVVKQDASGNKLWDKTFGGNVEDRMGSLTQTSDGGFILGGYSQSGISGDKTQANQGSWDYWVVKLDANGNKLWDKTFGGNSDDRLRSLSQTNDGGYILGGLSSSNISGDKSQDSKGSWDYWVVKLDAAGNKLWDKTLGGSNEDGLFTVIQATDGSYIVGGISKSTISGDKSEASRGTDDYWIIKLDGNGNKIWDKTFGGNDQDFFYSLAQTLDGGYVLGGYSKSSASSDKTQNGKGSWDYWIIKLNANGNKIWDKTVGGMGNDYFADLAQTSDGGYILVGGSDSPISGDKTQANSGRDYWLVKLNAAGNKLWDKTLGTASNEADVDGRGSIAQTSDGGYILGGVSNSGVSGDKTQPTNGWYDYWIIKLGSELVSGTKEFAANNNLSLSPNPNHGQFKLQLSNLNETKAEVTVSDLLGRVVMQKEIQTANNQLSEELTLPNAKGIYLLQLKAGEEIITRKIVVE